MNSTDFVADNGKADYAIERGEKTVVVELKGRDVEHGADQIFATASLWFNLQRCEQISGLIVARQYPRASTAIQLKQQKFARKYKGPLHVVCTNREYDFDKAMSFRLGK